MVYNPWWEQLEEIRRASITQNKTTSGYVLLVLYFVLFKQIHGNNVP